MTKLPSFYDKNTCEPQVMRVSPIEISAAHFIHTTDCKSQCQRLHGHNYMTTVDIEGYVNPVTRMIIDAYEIKEKLSEYDHKTLIDRSICCGTILVKGKEYIICENPATELQYTLPKRDVVLLDGPTTAENMARIFADSILNLSLNLTKVYVTLFETSKMCVCHESRRDKDISKGAIGMNTPVGRAVNSMLTNPGILCKGGILSNCVDPYDEEDEEDAVKEKRGCYGSRNK